MIDPPDPRNRLIAEAFTEDWSSGPGSDFARQAAARARRTRRVRQVLASGGALAALVLAAVVSFRGQTPAVIASMPQSAETFEVISDDQLIAAWGNRPLLILPKESEGRRIVLLRN